MNRRPRALSTTDRQKIGESVTPTPRVAEIYSRTYFLPRSIVDLVNVRSSQIAHGRAPAHR